MEPKVKTSQETPGAALRQAREARRLSLDEAAQALRLSPRIIAALEDDAYDRLPGPTYVRGYLRNYAQFLQLAPQPLIDTYNRRPEAAQRAEMTAPAPVRQATSSDAMVRLGTVLVAVIVLGLAALWWSGKNALEIAPRTSTPAPTEDVVSAPADQPEPESQTVPATEPPAETPATTPSPEVNVATPPPAVEAPSVPRGTPARAAPALDPNVPNVPLARLVLYMHEDSWADVRDAQQRRLLYETIPAGRVVTVEGVAPLSVFLGNVAGVTVEFNGQQYDASRHKRGEVARFTLGAPRG